MTPTLPEPTTEEGRAGLAALLSTPRTALVATDVDGTLAPIVDRPEDARAAAGATAALAALARHVGTVAVVTGRPAAVAVEMVGLDRVPGAVALGHYGVEQWEHGRLSAADRPAGVDAARAALAALLEGAPAGVALEDKGFSVAVHTRRAADPEGALAALRGRLGRIADDNGLETVPGRAVIELRPPGVDKGSALTALARARAARCVVFAGDDRGDLPVLDAVRALRREGVSGLVVCSDSPESPEELRRGADLVVDGPEGVVRLFMALARALAGGRASGDLVAPRPAPSPDR